MLMHSSSAVLGAVLLGDVLVAAVLAERVLHDDGLVEAQVDRLLQLQSLFT